MAQKMTKRVECLQDFKAVKNSLKASRKQTVTALYKFVFEEEGDRGNRQRLREFEGFDYDEAHAKCKQKLAYVKANLNAADLTSICILLGLRHDEEDQPAYIFRNLRADHLLQDATNDGEDEPDETGDEDEDDETILPRNDNRNDVVSVKNVETNVSEEEGAHTEVAAEMQNISVQRMHPPRFALSFRDIEESVRSFDGSDDFAVESWIEEFEETAEMMGWDEFQKFVFAKKMLKGVALLFIKSERGITSWMKLRKALVEEYKTTINSAKIHKMLSERKVKKDEDLQEYFLYMKQIASQGSIENSVLIQYVIDGIQDPTSSKIILYGASSLKEFKEKLKCYAVICEKSRTKYEPKATKTQMHQDVSQNGHSTNNILCYNCGRKGHKSVNCVDKDKGVKCFKCNTFGHYAKNCISSKDESKSNTRCVSNAEDRMMKRVDINNIVVKALFDTGSKYNLLAERIYRKLPNVVLAQTLVRLVGFGNNENDVKPIGKFQCTIQADDQSFEINLLVVPNKFMNVEMIIGEEFCIDKEVKIDSNGVHFGKISKQAVDQEPNVMAIGEVYENEVDVDHSAAKTAREEVLQMIENYELRNAKAANVSMKIVLYDESPIYSRPYRLPFADRKCVEQQIEKWLADGIIEPSVSEFSSPVVLVKKRDGTPRLCVDYRKINKAMVKERFPLPLIKDQLDNLQGAKVFSTIDLTNGFFHVDVDEGSRKYTSFVTHHG